MGNNLNNIKLCNHKNNIVSISNPRLLWECSCMGNYKKNKDKCLIHKNFSTTKEAKGFTKDFNKGLVQIEFDGIKLFWINENNLWPPSIDSLHLISDLKYLGYDKKKLNSIIDIGSGTGILGIWLGARNKSIKIIHFTDWLLLPLFFSYANVMYNKLKSESKYLLGLNTSFISTEEKETKYDLLICNPPYLPELGFKKLGKENTVAGTQLLKSILKFGQDVGKILVISFSDIVLPEAKKAAEYAGINLEKCKKGGPHKVPFRIPFAFKVKGYIEKLLKERAGAITEDQKSDFRYWHTINTYIIEKNTQE